MLAGEYANSLTHLPANPLCKSTCWYQLPGDFVNRRENNGRAELKKETVYRGYNMKLIRTMSFRGVQ